MGKVIAICNQKGGVGKTTTTVNLGAALAFAGKNVLLIDSDAQGHTTNHLGYEADEIDYTLTNAFYDVMDGNVPEYQNLIISYADNIDLIPGNILLADRGETWMQAMCRETMLKRVVEPLKDKYDYVIIDCGPSLDILTINDLAAADSVIIPVQSNYLASKGLESLIRTIYKVKRSINPVLEVEGILFTFCEERTKLSRDTIRNVQEAFGPNVNIFKTKIPKNNCLGEASAVGTNIFNYNRSCKGADAYSELMEEVTENESGNI